jgi:toxin secretion/phage lysis holin
VCIYFDFLTTSLIRTLRISFFCTKVLLDQPFRTGWDKHKLLVKAQEVTEVNRYELIYGGVVAALGAAAGYLFGNWYPLIGLLITFITLDYLAGLLAAAYEGRLSSKVGFRGIAKKVMIFLIVAVAHLSDQIIGLDHVVMNTTIYFYLANELLSIVENAGRTGLPVPQPIRNMIEILKGKKKG